MRWLQGLENDQDLNSWDERKERWAARSLQMSYAIRAEGGLPLDVVSAWTDSHEIWQAANAAVKQLFLLQDASVPSDLHCWVVDVVLGIYWRALGFELLAKHVLGIQVWEVGWLTDQVWKRNIQIILIRLSLIQIYHKWIGNKAALQNNPCGAKTFNDSDIYKSYCTVCQITQAG